MKARLTGVTVVLWVALLLLVTGCQTLNSSPVASFTCTPSSGQAPLTVSFDASSSYDSNGSIALYAWNFGDSGRASGVTTQHVYANPGFYTVNLAVTNDKGVSNSVTRTIEVSARFPQPEPVIFRGIGDSATKVFTLTSGLATFEMHHSGSSNFAVWLYDTNGKAVDLLANEIGAYSGTALEGVHADSMDAAPGTYLLEVTADGAWEITVQQPTYTSGESLPWRDDETGDAVTGPFQLPTGTIEFTLSHNGSSNFIVWLYSTNGEARELLANEIGTYHGSQIVGIQPGSFGTSPGVYLLSVRADGDWSVSISKR